MKYYTSTAEYNCGIDLHAHQMYVRVMDRQGKKLVHCNILPGDNPWVYCCVFLARAVALDHRAGRPRVDRARPGLHSGPIEPE